MLNWEALRGRAKNSCAKVAFYRSNPNLEEDKIYWKKRLKTDIFQETAFSAMRKVVP